MLEFDGLPDDTISEVLNQLSAFDFIGAYDKRLVCHRWNSLYRIRLPHQLNIPKTELLRTCDTREKALALLSDETFCNTLSFNQWLQLVSHFETIVAQIMFKLGKEDLLLLIDTNPKLGMLFYNTPQICIIVGHLELAKRSIDVARAIYRNEKLMRPVSLLTFDALCHHIELFYDFVATGQHNRFINARIADIIRRSHEVAEWYVKNRYTELNNTSVDIINALFQYESACHLILDKYNAARVSRHFLCMMGVSFQSVAARILAEPAFADTLTEKNKQDLSEHYPDAEERYTIENLFSISIPDLDMNKLLSLGKPGLQHALSLLKCPDLGPLLDSEHLYYLALASQQAGFTIFENENFSHKLNHVASLKLYKHCIGYARFGLERAKAENNFYLIHTLLMMFPKLNEEYSSTDIYQQIQSFASESGFPITMTTGNRLAVIKLIKAEVNQALAQDQQKAIQRLG